MFKHECLLPTYAATKRQRGIAKCLAALYVAYVSLSVVEGFSVRQFRRRHFVDSRLVTSLLSPRQLSGQTITLLSAAGSSQNERSKQKTKQKFQRGSAPNKKTALKWCVQAIERYAEDPKLSVEKPSSQLLDALYGLQRGKKEYCTAGCCDFIVNQPDTERCMPCSVLQHERKDKWQKLVVCWNRWTLQRQNQ